MKKEVIIQKTVKAMQALPDDKANEISEFADFVLRKYEDHVMQKGLQELQSKNETFDFLNNDEDLYTIADIKEKL